MSTATPPAAAVIGAGIVGICCALALQRRGVPTTLIDRAEPGRGASFGNAGLIQAEAVVPYAMPRTPGVLAAMVAKRTPAFDYSLRGMAENARALWDYWRGSAPAAHARSAAAYAPLIRAAGAAHEVLIAEADAAGCIGGRGLTEIYRSEAALAARLAEVECTAAPHGAVFEVWRGRPPEGLGAITGPVAGGLTWTEPLAVNDPHALAMRYLDRFRAGQGRVLHGDGATAERSADGWQVPTEAGPLTVAHLVLCPGAALGDLARLTGFRVPMVPKRGYHMHFRPDPARGLAHPVLDGDNGYVLAPMRAGLRLTTGAQILARAEKPDPVQVARAERAARQTFAIGERVDAAAWTGVRPCTPDMLPLIGPVPGREGLWIAGGHGHQGLTLAALTGQLIAEAITGAAPSLPLEPYAPARFAA